MGDTYNLSYNSHFQPYDNAGTAVTARVLHAQQPGQVTYFHRTSWRASIVRCLRTNGITLKSFRRTTQGIPQKKSASLGDLDSLALERCNVCWRQIGWNTSEFQLGSLRNTQKTCQRNGKAKWNTCFAILPTSTTVLQSQRIWRVLST